MEVMNQLKCNKNMFILVKFINLSKTNSLYGVHNKSAISTQSDWYVFINWVNEFQYVTKVF